MSAPHSGTSSPRSGSVSPRLFHGFGGPNSCTHCQKKVFYAERKEYDGNVFHISCFNKWFKERNATTGGNWNSKYLGAADVQPFYYRTGDGESGPRMESGSEYKTRS